MPRCRLCGGRTSSAMRTEFNRFIEAQDNGGKPLCAKCFRGARP